MNLTHIGVLAIVIGLALSRSSAQQTIRLWPKDLGKSDKDNPTLTVYVPDTVKPTGAAIIVCPGGAYRGLAKHEGEDYARFLTSYGITAFVLKYRLGPQYDSREITADADAGDADCAGWGSFVEPQSKEDRDHGIFSRRTSCVDDDDALRRRRSGSQ